jgi:hypothetical protein
MAPDFAMPLISRADLIVIKLFCLQYKFSSQLV